MRIVSSAAFKGMVAKRAPIGGDVVVRKEVQSTAEALTGYDDRRIRFTISTATPDRENDVVRVSGWDLAAFRRNPVVLWGHDSDSLPIAKCVEIGVVGSKLQAVAEFVPADMPDVGPRAEAVLRMLRTGFLSATSVGFRPLSYEIDDKRRDAFDWPGIDYTSQELMEFSVVSIPCLPEALIEPGQRTAAPALEQRAARPVRDTPFTGEQFRAAKDPGKMGTVERMAEQAALRARMSRIKANQTHEARKERRRIEARLLLLGSR